MGLGKAIKKAALGTIAEISTESVFSHSASIGGQALLRPHGLRSDIALVLAFWVDVKRLVPSFEMHRVTGASVYKQWENTGKSQPYLDAVKVDMVMDDGYSAVMDIWYYPSGSVWKAETHLHDPQKTRHTFLVRRPDDKEQNPLELESAQVHLNIEHEWKLKA